MEGGSGQTMGDTRDGDAEDALERTQAQGTTDVWRDQKVLHQMQHGKFPPGSTPKERDRIVYRMARFHWENGLVFQRWPDRTRKVVSRPDQRAH